MKLPQLPRLKKMKTARTPTGLKPMPGKEKGRGTGIPKRPLRANEDVPVFSTVEPKEGGFGGETWFETDCAATDKAAVGGTCAKCGSKVRAIDLRLRRTKDGDEYWKCIWC